MNVQIFGAKQLVNKLGKINKFIDNPQPALKLIGKEATKEFKLNFKAEGKILDAPWKKRKKSYPWPLMQRSGKLKRTWKQKDSKAKTTVTNPVKYAKYHQFGTPKLPIRKLVGSSRKILDIVKKIITKNLLKVINS